MTSRGFLALTDLAEHIIDGPRSIWIDDDKDWLESFIRLRQVPLEITGSPMEGAAIYVIPRVIGASARTVVLRTVAWDREGDRTMNKRWPVQTPTATVEYFRLSDEDLPPLDAAARKLQQELKLFPPEGLAIDLANSDEATLQKPRAAGKPEKTMSRRLSLVSANGSIQLGFLSTSVPEIDAAWHGLWSELRSRRHTPLPPESIRETYNIDPRTYARILFAGD